MYEDLPEIKRCCFCVPARRGFLVWIYIKLMMSIITLCPLVFIVSYYSFVEYMSLTFASVAIVMLAVEVVMDLVAVVGAHTKRVDLLKSYYKYSIFSLVEFTIVYLALFILNLYVAGLFNGYHPYLWYCVIWYSVVGFASVAVQVYMLLLLRSIVHKLGSNCKFRYINHAAEAEAKCAMDIDRTFIRKIPDECSKGLDNDKGLESENVVKQNNRSKNINVSIEDDWRQIESSEEKEGPDSKRLRPAFFD